MTAPESIGCTLCEAHDAFARELLWILKPIEPLNRPRVFFETFSKGREGRARERGAGRQKEPVRASRMHSCTFATVRLPFVPAVTSILFWKSVWMVCRAPEKISLRCLPTTHTHAVKITSDGYLFKQYCRLVPEHVSLTDDAHMPEE